MIPEEIKSVGIFEEDLKSKENIDFEKVLFFQLNRICSSELSDFSFSSNIDRLLLMLKTFFSPEDFIHLEEIKADKSQEEGEISRAILSDLLMPVMRREGYLGEPRRKLRD
jgi:hypothetical protein